MYSHIGRNPFPCDQCDKAFKSSNQLKTHKKITHQGIRPYTCDICNKRFALTHDYKRHLITHSAKGKFACDLCDKLFTGQGNLNAHKKFVHQQIRLFTCQHCDQRFSTSSYLKYHLTGSTKEEQTSFNCDKCNESYSHICTLRKHQQLTHGKNQSTRKRSKVKLQSM